jgi:hypothetical protein
MVKVLAVRMIVAGIVQRNAGLNLAVPLADPQSVPDMFRAMSLIVVISVRCQIACPGAEAYGEFDYHLLI